MSKISVPNMAGSPVEVEPPRRGLSYRLVRAWHLAYTARQDLDALHALIVRTLITGRTPGDRPLLDAGDEALDALLADGWTPRTLSATAQAFIEQVTTIYPPIQEVADFSKAQPAPTTAT